MQALHQSAVLGGNVGPKYSNKHRQTGCKQRCQLALRSMKAYPPMTFEESRRYYDKIKSGDTEARNEFILCSLRLVAKFAEVYSKYNFDYDELFSEFSAILVVEVDRWDINRGAFSTLFGRAVLSWVRYNARRNASYREKLFMYDPRRTKGVGESMRTQKVFELLRDAVKDLPKNHYNAIEKTFKIFGDEPSSMGELPSRQAMEFRRIRGIKSLYLNLRTELANL